jgi:hypothetical protein
MSWVRGHDLTVGYRIYTSVSLCDFYCIGRQMVVVYLCLAKGLRISKSVYLAVNICNHPSVNGRFALHFTLNMSPCFNNAEGHFLSRPYWRWTQPLLLPGPWAMPSALFILVISQVGSCCCLGLASDCCTPISDTHTAGITCVPSCLALLFLDRVLLTFLPALTFNPNLPDSASGVPGITDESHPAQLSRTFA